MLYLQQFVTAKLLATSKLSIWGVSLKSVIPNWTIPILKALYSWSAPLGNKPPEAEKKREQKTGKWVDKQAHFYIGGEKFKFYIIHNMNKILTFSLRSNICRCFYSFSTAAVNTSRDGSFAFVWLTAVMCHSQSFQINPLSLTNQIKWSIIYIVAWEFISKVQGKNEKKRYPHPSAHPLPLHPYNGKTWSEIKNNNTDNTAGHRRTREGTLSQFHRKPSNRGAAATPRSLAARWGATTPPQAG